MPNTTLTSPPTRRRNGQPILPIIYAQSQTKTRRFLPILIVASCGVWIFAMGALLERLPPGNTLPMPIATTPVLWKAHQDIHIIEERAGDSNVKPVRAIVERDVPIRVLEEADSPDKQLVIQRLQPRHQSSDVSTPKIPNVLIFTHAVNLLTYQPPNDMTNKTKDQIEEQKELLVLQKNVQDTIALHPKAKVRFLTDQDCIQSLTAALGENAPLIHYFEKETTGMYKADICRGAALWETGGIYLDVDVGVRMPLTEVLAKNTTFATSMVHRDSQHLGSFFQAFMASTARHAILERYLQLFLEHYQGKHRVKNGPLGVILLRKAFDDVVLEKPNEVLAMNGKAPESVKGKDKDFRLGPQTLDTVHHGQIQLWQEILYHPKYFQNVPPPTWGTRRACHFVVVANRKFPLMVPMYSRIAGSRMCPPNANNVVES